MRRGAIFQLLILAAIIGVVMAVTALYPNWLPPTASEQAERIHDVFWYVTVICAAIFSIVGALLIYSIVKFRAAPGDDSDGLPIHGHTGLEIAWTAVPFLLVTSMGIFSAVVLARNDRTGSDPLKIDVTAQQFAWSFKYPQQKNLATNILRLPVNRTVQFHLKALDVIHSFWVPEFSQKQDAVPGIDTYVTVTPNKTGTFPIICTELCGLGHATMRSTVIVMNENAWNKWVQSASAATAGGAGANAGKAVFDQNGCGGCHTFKAANATGKVGPDLDKLPQEAQTAGKPLEDFVRESIVNPDAYIEKGFPANVMPPTFKSLPKDQLDALVQFLVSGSGGAK